ncbi:MAG TPA: carboxynorspermidine decarboxylase [Ruminococcaceae bacterium]|nr:carboxynorspermidine decarboxylase [Oscillospiraceae bacterium]
MKLDLNALATPCYIVDEDLLKKNLLRLKSVSDITDCRILLAQKGFSMFGVYPLISRFLSGSTASGLYEARLGHEHLGGETHIFSPAYREDEFDEILSICDHIVFNSFAQWRKFRSRVKHCGRRISCGLRINPEYSEIKTELYDPCAPFSRLGVTIDRFEPDELEGIEGLHFHTMCEQNADVLMRTLRVVEEKFEPYLRMVKWVNFGGGHHITRKDYDIAVLISCVSRFSRKYGVRVYLEPGEAVALNAGYLAARVLDTVENDMSIAVLDTSAACHMPDVLEMPYRPEIVGAASPGKQQFTYRLSGPTCLAGDVIGDYSFREPLKPGDVLIFCDMAHYTMVKNNTFNGMRLPSICLYSEAAGLRTLKSFGYEDFKGRLS